MKELGNAEMPEVGRWTNNRCETQHLPFRRRERAILRFRPRKSLRKPSSVHAAFHNPFNQERHRISREA
jgi:putative transposase